MVLAETIDARYGVSVDLVLERLLSYALMPLYMLGRVLHLLFPVAVYVVNLAQFGWREISLLHHVLTLVLVGLLVAMASVSWRVMYFAFCLYHIGEGKQSMSLTRSIMGEIDEHYVQVVQFPIIAAFFDQEFGQDVAGLILMYLKSFELE